MKMLLAGLALALSACGPQNATAPDTPTVTGTMNADMPPERFRGNTAAIVVFTDRAGINEMCGTAPEGYHIVACKRNLKGNGAPVIFMPNPCIVGDFEYYAKIMCHELGHVNSWSGDHEL